MLHILSEEETTEIVENWLNGNFSDLKSTLLHLNRSQLLTLYADLPFYLASVELERLREYILVTLQEEERG